MAAYDDLFAGVQGTGADSAYTGGPSKATYTPNDPAAAQAYRNQQLTAQGLVNDGSGNYYQPGYSDVNKYMQGVQSANTSALTNSGIFSGVQGGGAPSGSGGSSGVWGGGLGFPGSSGYQQNPYLRDQMGALTAQYQQQFLQNTLPQIRSGYQASGQYGGSRQGIAEGVAAGNAATGLSSALANLNAGTYQTDTSNALQKQSLDNNLYLGNRTLDLGFTNANNNFYTNQRGQDLNQMALGADLASKGITGQVGVGQEKFTTGNAFQKAPATIMSLYNELMGPYATNGQSTTSSTQGGGGTGAVGGAMMMAALMSKLKDLGFSS